MPTPPSDDFRAETLLKQLRRIYRGSVVARNPRLAWGVAGWALLATLASGFLGAVIWAQALGLNSNLIRDFINHWMFSLFYIVDDELIWIGSVHLVLWWQWSTPRPSIRRFVGLALLMSVTAVFLRTPPVIATYRVDFFLIQWLNQLLFFPWFVLLVRSSSAWVGFRWVTSKTDVSTPPAKTSWSLRGLFLATLLVAVTIVVKQWIHSMPKDNSPLFLSADFKWVNVLVQTYTFLNLLLLVNVSAAIFVQRRFRLPVVLIGLHVILTAIMAAANTVLLAGAGYSWRAPEMTLAWFTRVAITIGLHLIVFRVWRWAGFPLEPANPDKND